MNLDRNITIKNKEIGRKVQDDKNSGKIGIPEHALALLLGVFIVYGILSKTGTIQSGYHFLDDHELIRMQLGFESQGVTLWQGIRNWLTNDLWWRFRPLYWIERLTGAYFWGSELLYWNYYTAWKGIITFYCLYMCVRYLGYNRWISAVVPCVVMLGSQFSPWYRSANQESTGILLVAGCLMLIALQAYRKKYKSWCYNVPIIITAVLCGLVKESFTLFMPVFIALKLWLEYQEEGDFRKCLKNNILTYGAILCSMLINVGMILFYVGVDNVSYAGFQEGVPLRVYLNGIRSSLLEYTKWNTYIGGLILLLAVMCYKSIEKKDIMKYLPLTLTGAYICGVELVAHARSGMWERYIIPYIVGYVIVFILVPYRIFEKDRVHRVVFAGVLLLLLYKNVPQAYDGARSYAENGAIINEFLECIKENTSEKDEIICAFADEELNIATECWLETNGRTLTYSFVNKEWKNEVLLAGEVPQAFSGENAGAVVCYEWQIEDMLKLMGITHKSQYELHHFDGYSIVVRLKGTKG